MSCHLEMAISRFQPTQKKPYRNKNMVQVARPIWLPLPKLHERNGRSPGFFVTGEVAKNGTYQQITCERWKKMVLKIHQLSSWVING